MQEHKAATQSKIEKEMETSSAGVGGYAAFAPRANVLRQRAEAEAAANQAAAQNDDQPMAAAEEQKEEVKQEEARSIDQIIDDAMATKPWRAQMSTLTKSTKNFCKNRGALVKLLSELEGRAAPYEEFLDFFGGDEEMLFAVLL